MVLIVMTVAALALTPCPELDVRNPIQGRLLIDIAAREKLHPSFACVVESDHAWRIPIPLPGDYNATSWASKPTELLVSFCDPDRSTQRCPVILTSVTGERIRTFPPDSSPGFEEPDGRLTNWILDHPRSSPNAEFLAVSIGSTAKLLLRMADGVFATSLPGEAGECAWSPDSTHLACVEGSPTHGTQLFLYDLKSSAKRQLTHFESEAHPSWFAKTITRPALIASVSWAKRRDVISFCVAPDRGLFFWKPSGQQVAQITSLEGCYRDPQPSNDGDRIVYLSGNRPEHCINGTGDQVRMLDLNGSNDRVVVRTTSNDYQITHIDWWTD